MSRIDTLRRIVERHQYGKIDGQAVDAFTASRIVAVYDSLNREGGLFQRKPELREKFETMPLSTLVSFAYGQVRR